MTVEVAIAAGIEMIHIARINNNNNQIKTGHGAADNINATRRIELRRVKRRVAKCFFSTHHPITPLSFLEGRIIVPNSSSNKQQHTRFKAVTNQCLGKWCDQSSTLRPQLRLSKRRFVPFAWTHSRYVLFVCLGSVRFVFMLFSGDTRLWYDVCHKVSFHFLFAIVPTNYQMWTCVLFNVLVASRPIQCPESSLCQWPQMSRKYD
jgi:hypothetical protein